MDEFNKPNVVVGEFKFGGKIYFRDIRTIFENLVYIGDRRQFDYQFDAYHDPLSIVWEYVDGPDGMSSSIAVDPLNSDPSRLSDKVHKMISQGADRQVIEASDSNLADRVSASPELSYEEIKDLPLSYFSGCRIGNMRKNAGNTSAEFGYREIALQEKSGFYEVAIAARRSRAVERMAKKFQELFSDRAKLIPCEIELTI